MNVIMISITDGTGEDGLYRRTLIADTAISCRRRKKGTVTRHMTPLRIADAVRMSISGITGKRPLMSVHS